MPALMQEHPAPTTEAPAAPPLTQRLAWAGWQLQVPEDWTPVKIEGTFVRGSMFIGDKSGPFLMLKWWRPMREGQKEFSFPEWIERRFKKLHTHPQPHPPAPEGFLYPAWVKDLETKQKKSRTIWYGYHERAETVIEVLFTSLTEAAVRQRIMDEILPSLKMASKADPMPWSLFSASFVSPPGFHLVERHLFSGDIALRLENDSESLLLRTVYPAGLALSRRKLPKWLDASPFLERRKNRNTETQEWRSDAPKLKGVLRTGWKRLPFPLGWLKPRYCTAVVAVDKELDRLVLAEHRTPEPVSSETVIRAVQQMNQEVAG